MTPDSATGKPTPGGECQVFALPARPTAWALTDAAPAAFEALAHDFERARDARPSSEHVSYLQLCGFAARLRIVGSELGTRLLAPFGARVEPEPAASPPALTIDVWDEAATGVPCTVAPVDRNLGAYGLVTSSADGRFVALQRADTTSWLDVHANRILTWCRSADRLLLDERAKPFHKLLAVWLRERGVLLAHAGLVGRHGAGVLVTGKGGSGKSTTSLAAMLAGFDYLGDDFVGLAESSCAAVVGHGLYASALLAPRHLTRFPSLARIAVRPDRGHEEKSLLPLFGTGIAALPARLRITAIALPRIADAARASVRPASKAAALRALAPSTLALLPRPDRSVFDGLARIVARTPTYWLDLGRAIDSIPDCLAELIEKGRGDDARPKARP